MSAETNIYRHQIPGSKSLILRDGELFDVKLGVGCFNQSLAQRYKEETFSPGSHRHIWLSRETYQVAQRVESGQSVLIRGDLGSGKSAIVYGLRTYLRSANAPYYYVDGHFGTTPHTVIERKMDKSLRHGKILIWDSTDYLLGETRKVIRGNRQRYKERSSRLISAMSQFLDQGGRLVATTHLESWVNAFGDKDIANGHWRDIINRMSVHDVKGVFDNPNIAIQFYLSTGFTTEQAIYMAYLGVNDLFHSIVETAKNRIKLSERETAQLRNAPNTYKNAKLFAIDEREDAKKLRQTLKDLIDGKITEEQFLIAYALFTVDKNRETLNKKGLPRH